MRERERTIAQDFEKLSTELKFQSIKINQSQILPYWGDFFPIFLYLKHYISTSIM